MHRIAAAVLVAFSVCSCADQSSPPTPCTYELWNGSWSGTASYTSTTPTERDGVSGASALEGATEVTSCGDATGLVTLGGCSFSGQFTGARSMVLEPTESTCVVQLASETLGIRIREGSALIAANDTLQLSLGGDLVSREGVPLENTTVAFTFNGQLQ